MTQPHVTPGYSGTAPEGPIEYPITPEYRHPSGAPVEAVEADVAAEPADPYAGTPDSYARERNPYEGVADPYAAYPDTYLDTLTRQPAGAGEQHASEVDPWPGRSTGEPHEPVDGSYADPEPVTAPPAQGSTLAGGVHGSRRTRMGAWQARRAAEREVAARSRTGATGQGTSTPRARGYAHGNEIDDTQEIPAVRGDTGRGEGEGGTQEATQTTRRQRAAEWLRNKVFRRQRPTAAGGNEGNGEIPAHMERLPENFRPAVAEVVRLKKQLEENVGAGKGSQSQELQAAAARLKKLLQDHTESSTPAERLRLNAHIDEAVAAERIWVADEKVKGVIPNLGRGIDAVVGWMGRHKKVVGLTAVGLAVAATGGMAAGVALGAGAAMAAAAKGGLVIGGTAGAVKGYIHQRGIRAMANTQKAVQERYAYNRPEQLIPGVENPAVYDAAWYESSRKFRDAQGKVARNKIVGGAVVGAAAGAAVAAGGTGYGALGAEIFGGDAGQPVNGGENGAPQGGAEQPGAGPDPDNVPDYPPPPGEGAPGGGEGNGAIPGEGREAVEEAIKGIVEDDPGRINEVPGLEDRNFHEVTAESAAEQYPGEYPWSSLETGAELNNQQTFNAIIDGWSELHDTPGVKLNTWGDIQFNEATGKFETTGDLWGGDVTVDNLYAVDANGDIYHFNGKLDSSQHAQLLDLMRQDGSELMNADQLAEHLAEDVDTSAFTEQAEQAPEKTARNIPADVREALDTQADAVAEELRADFVGDSRITQNEAQSSLNSYVANHQGAFAELSSPGLNEYLSREVAQQTQAALGNQTPEWVNPAEVQRMLDEAWRAANVGVQPATGGGRFVPN